MWRISAFASGTNNRTRTRNTYNEPPPATDGKGPRLFIFLYLSLTRPISSWLLLLASFAVRRLEGPSSKATAGNADCRFMKKPRWDNQSHHGTHCCCWRERETRVFALARFLACLCLDCFGPAGVTCLVGREKKFCSHFKKRRNEECGMLGKRELWYVDGNQKKEKRARFGRVLGTWDGWHEEDPNSLGVS
jgi:hypothetical protein